MNSKIFWTSDQDFTKILSGLGPNVSGVVGLLKEALAFQMAAAGNLQHPELGVLKLLTKKTAENTYFFIGGLYE